MGKKTYTEEQERWIINSIKENKYERTTDFVYSFNEMFGTNKTWNLLKDKINRLDLVCNLVGENEYTCSEKEWIIENFNKYPSVKDAYVEFNKIFNTNRSILSFRGMANSKLNLKRSVRTVRKNGYTDEQLEWIRKNYSSFFTVKDALESFNATFSLNKSEQSFFSKASRLGCRLGKFHTEEQKKWIMQNFPIYNTMEELAIAYNQKFSTNMNGSSINKIICKLGLQQREVHNYTQEEDKWLTENFQKDTWDNLAIEFNMIFDSNITGNKLRNRSYSIGLIREDSHEFISNKRYNIGDEIKKGKYIRVKIKECEHNGSWNDKKRNECWTTKQRVVWEQHHKKKIPDDCQIIFLNGNENDFDIDNLYCIKKKYLSYMRTNHWFSTNPEVTLTAIKWCELMYATQE